MSTSHILTFYITSDLLCIIHSCCPISFGLFSNLCSSVPFGHQSLYFPTKISLVEIHRERTSMILHSRMTMENLLENLQGDSPRWPWRISRVPWRICYVVPWRISKVLEILQGWQRFIYELWHFISNRCNQLKVLRYSRQVEEKTFWIRLYWSKKRCAG